MPGPPLGGSRHWPSRLGNRRSGSALPQSRTWPTRASPSRAATTRMRSSMPRQPFPLRARAPVLSAGIKLERGASAIAAVLGVRRAAKNADEMAAELKQQLGQNSVPLTTPGTTGHMDLAGKAHCDKATQTSIPTPHVQTRQINIGPSGEVNLGKETTRAATKQDIRVARELERRRGNR